jgi:pyruvate dehydrogenase (quinone)
MIGTKADYHAVMHCDLFLMLGTDYPYSEFLPRKGAVIQVDERARVIGRRAPTELGVIGSVRPTVKSLLDKAKPKSDSSFFEIVTAQRKKWDEMLDKQSDPARSKDRIHPQAVARAVSDLAARDAVFTIDTGLNTLWSGNWIRQSGEQRIIGSFNNGAVGTALGQANGIQALDRSRQVIALCGSSAAISRLGGTVSPSALAVLRLTTNSNLEACITGRSAGLSPLRILPTYTPAWR